MELEEGEESAPVAQTFDENFLDLRTWEQQHVRDMYDAWLVDLEMKLQLTRDDLNTLIAQAAWAEGKDFAPLFDKMFASLARNDAINAIALLACIILAAHGPEEERFGFVFTLMDVGDTGAIFEDDFGLASISAFFGLVAFVHSGAVPEEGFEEACQELAREAFEEARAAGSEDGLTRDSFIAFAKSRASPEGAPVVTPDAILSFWNLVDEVYDDPDLDAEGDQAPRADEEDMFFAEDTGEHFMAVKPWIGAIREPSNPPEAINAPPVEELTLEHVHGYRSFDSRNNLRITASGKLVYHTAALGVILDQASNTQRFFFGHNDDIVSLSMHPNARFIATGELGRYPTIRIWDAEGIDWDVTPAVHPVEICSIRVKSIRRAASALAWSPSGGSLAIVGNDDQHTLHVFDVQPSLDAYESEGAYGTIPAPTLSGHTKTHTNKVLDCEWQSDTVVGVVGLKFSTFYTVGASSTSRGLFGRKGKIQPLACCTRHNGALLAGTASGHIYVFQGRSVSKIIKAHPRTIYAMSVTPDGGVLTGSRDGEVKLWNADFELQATLNLAEKSTATRKAIRSVHSNGSRIAIGTLGAEIWETDADLAGEPALVHAGHCGGETWALAHHPTEPLYATAGDDGTVRVWDAITRTCLRSGRLPSWSRCLTWSPDGSMLAAGLGGRLGGIIPRINGAIVLVDAESLEVVAKAKPSKRYIQEIKFSPDGSALAIGSHDSNVYIYDIDGQSLSKRAVCSGHSSYITHIDWSEDGSALQTNCGAYELLFWDASDGSQRTGGATELRDEKWATWTCTLGWPVQGIWPPYSDGTDVNAVDRSHSGTLLATADDFGRVKLFRNPCIEKGWAYAEYAGHSSHVTNVRWLLDDAYIISTGGNDKSVFQWKNATDPAAVEDEQEAEIYEASGEYGQLAEVDMPAAFDALPDRTMAPEMLALLGGDGHATSELIEAEEGKVLATVTYNEAGGGGEFFMAVKPWIGAIKPPSEAPEVDSSAPGSKLDLRWVHGYQAQTMRNSLRYVSTGDIVYTVAALGLTFNVETQTQEYFLGKHSDDIVGLAVSPCGRYIATGERGRRPTIFVWDAETKEVLAKLEGNHRRAVPLLAFSPDGNRLATVGLDDEHTIIVYSWRTGTRIVSQRGDTRRILGLAWAPDGRTLCTVGVRHVYFWEMNGSSFRRRRGILGRKGKQQTIASVVYLADGRAVAGCSSGDLYIFGGNSLKTVVKAHDAPVDSLYFDAEADALFSGARNGVARVWSGSDLSQQAEHAIPSGASVRSICCKPGDASAILMGSAHSEVFSIDAETGEPMMLLEGHYYGETWGATAHPTENCYATVGDDGTLRVWDADLCMVRISTQVGAAARAVSFSPDGQFLAIGMGGRLGGNKISEVGDIAVYETETLEKVAEANASERWVQDIKFSPDGTALAVGCHDTKIHIFDFADGALSKRAVCSGHSSYITHIDWSEDGSALQTNCGAYELLFWDASDGSQRTGGATELRDEKWATWTCTLGWPVQGIWPDRADGTDVNAVDRSHSGTLLATADDFGRVKLFRNPCTEKRAAYTYALGHSSHVTNARWLADDATLVTTGGNDRGVFQWTVVDE